MRLNVLASVRFIQRFQHFTPLFHFHRSLIGVFRNIGVGLNLLLISHQLLHYWVIFYHIISSAKAYWAKILYFFTELVSGFGICSKKSTSRGSKDYTDFWSIDRKFIQAKIDEFHKINSPFQWRQLWRRFWDDRGTSRDPPSFARYCPEFPYFFQYLKNVFSSKISTSCILF